MFAILLALATTGGNADATCDLAELNYVYHWKQHGDGDSNGEWQPVLVQWVFWDWSPRHGCYVVRTWVMARSGTMPTRIGGQWVLPIKDSRTGQYVTVRPRVVIVTRTQTDVELDNRLIVSPECRRPLK